MDRVALVVTEGEELLPRGTVVGPLSNMTCNCWFVARFDTEFRSPPPPARALPLLWMENDAKSEVSAAFTQLAALRDFSRTTWDFSSCTVVGASFPSASVGVALLVELLSGEFRAVESASDTATAFFRDWCSERKYSTDGCGWSVRATEHSSANMLQKRTRVVTMSQFCDACKPSTIDSN